MDKSLTFSAELNKCLRKMAVAIKSIYCVQHMVPLETRIMLFRSLVLSHLSSGSAFFQNLPMSQINRINRQINSGIKVCYLHRKYVQARDQLLKSKVLQAELFIAQHSLTRMFHEVKNIRKNDIGRQFIYNRVPVKLNELTKQIKN